MAFPQKDMFAAVMARYHNRLVCSATQESWLHYVAAAGDVESAEMLVERGYEVDILDLECQTPLHYAVMYSQVNLANDGWFWIYSPPLYVYLRGTL